MPPLVQLLAASGVVALGSLLQGTVGFGLGLFAAPLLLLLDPGFVPGPLIVCSGVLTVLLARREWHAVRTADLKWAIGGRVGGTGLALAALATVPAERLEVLFGGLILAAVGLTADGVRLRPGPRVLLGAGAVSGFMGTITAVGGPPIALVYQHESGPRIRGTLSAFFVAGVLLSVAGLAAIGRFGPAELLWGALLLPGTLLGYFVSRFTVRGLNEAWLRPAVLAVAGASALAVVLRALL